MYIFCSGRAGAAGLHQMHLPWYMSDRRAPLVRFLHLPPSLAVACGAAATNANGAETRPSCTGQALAATL